VTRSLLFSVLCVVLGLGTLLIVMEAAAKRSACRIPVTETLGFPLAICGVSCLLLARDRSERFPVAVLLVLATIGGAADLIQPTHQRNDELVAVGDVRTVLSGEAAYQSVNGGYYDTLECLARPAFCVRGYPPTSPSFLDVQLAQQEPYNQYRHWLVPGRPVTDRPRSASRTSIRTFAYVAVPVDSRMRSFCGDDTGVIFQAPDGITPNIRNAQCDDPRFTALK
jgi:hypothetical protein